MKILVAGWDSGGGVEAVQTVVGRAVARGHEVRVLGTEGLRSRFESAGATFLRYRYAPDNAFGHHSAIDLLWATAIAFLLGDQAATLELGRRAIRGLQWAGRIRMALVLYMIAGALLTARPDAAAIIQGAAEAYVVESPTCALLSPALTASLGQERARELRARGASMDWDQAVAYALTQATQALSELRSETQP